MKKSKIVKRLTKCILPRRICRVYMKYAPHYDYYFPLKVNDKFFLGAVEDDFQLDGYTIRRVKQVQRAEIRDDKCLDIDIQEGLVDRLYVPNVSLSSWRSIFRSLKDRGRNIIVEHEDDDPDKCRFYVGKIETINPHSIRLHCFDADGVWDEKPTKIRYSDITSVSFGSRYIEVFSKYVPQP